MKEIMLTRGLVTQVDDSDYDFLMQWKWYVARTSWGYYAARNSNENDNILGKRIQIWMHKVILNIPITSKLKGDHIDRNRLNNQRNNLRKATNSQNAINTIHINCSGYRGVYYDSYHNKFKAQIRINNKNKNLGSFDNPIEAAKKYDRYALRYQGEFAITNF